MNRLSINDRVKQEAFNRLDACIQRCDPKCAHWIVAESEAVIVALHIAVFPTARTSAKRSPIFRQSRWTLVERLKVITSNPLVANAT